MKTFFTALSLIVRRIKRVRFGDKKIIAGDGKALSAECTTSANKGEIFVRIKTERKEISFIFILYP